MRKALLLTVVILGCASVAFAQWGSVDLFSDPMGASCNFTEAPPAMMYVYMFHMNVAAGATAVQFKIEPDPCFTGVYVFQALNFTLVIGNVNAGVSIAYGGCLTGDINLGFAGYSVTGQTPNCCYLHVVPDPVDPANVWAADCSDPVIKRAITGGSGIINPDASCECTTPNEENSWGKIKSLYQ